MILAFDTCMSRCSAALWSDGTLVAGRAEDMRVGHAERLVPMIAELLAETGQPGKAVEGIVVTTGPGTFTGQRVGLSVARGLMLSWGVPGVGISCFEALAAGHTASEGVFHVCFDARRGQVYWQSFSANGTDFDPLGEGECLPIAEAQARFAARPAPVLGTAGAVLGTEDGGLLPDARIFGRLWGRYEPGPGRLVRPLYLRAPDAQLPHNPPPRRGEAPGR